MKKALILSSILLTGNVLAEGWDRSNNPRIFNPIMKSKMNYAFNELPLAAKIADDRFGWSETYWPSNKGGIAFRWNSQNPEVFKYKLKTKEELMKMSESDLNELSPAELYDIALGDYNYSLTKKVLARYSPKDLWWEGICHGWALAASNYAEPQKVVVTNKDGIKVPFGSSDVKGLLSMHEAFNSHGFYVRVGDRCKAKGKVVGEELPQDGKVVRPSSRQASKDSCRDVNAGTFHLVLTNMIGINSHGFIADVDRYADVWNQPVTSYESKIVKEWDVKGGDVVRKVQIQTIMTYAEELVFYSPEKAAEGTLGFVSKDPVTATPAQTFTSKNYEYILELDRSGNIIGGQWLTETRPDMLWMKSPNKTFVNGEYPLAGLNLIYKPVEH